MSDTAQIISLVKRLEEIDQELKNIQDLAQYCVRPDALAKVKLTVANHEEARPRPNTNGIIWIAAHYEIPNTEEAVKDDDTKYSASFKSKPNAPLTLKILNLIAQELVEERHNLLRKMKSIGIAV